MGDPTVHQIPLPLMDTPGITIPDDVKNAMASLQEEESIANQGLTSHQ